LKNLKTLWLNNNNLTKAEKKGIKKLLRHCRITF